MLLTFSNITGGLAYWGEGDDDCLAEHGLSHHYATYIESPEIVIDGKDDDAAWNREDVYEYTIPMANNVLESTRFFISYMYTKYIYDGTYLYMRATWNDTTPGDLHDMAMFCWNINCSNYTTAMFTDPAGMVTPNPGERVDSWQWICNNRANGSTNELRDRCFDDIGWSSFPDETVEDVSYGYTLGTWRDGARNFYQLEMRRPMVPSNPSVDATFVEGEPIRFSTAVADAMENQEHAISWTYDLNLTTNPLPDTYVPPTPSNDDTEEESTIPGYSSFWILISAITSISVFKKKHIKVK